MPEESTPPPSGSSRRRFLAVAGTGAAAAGAVAALSPLTRADGATPTAPAAGVDGPLVAFVTDAATGELTIMHGEREVVVRDRALVATLTHKLAKGV